MSDIILETRGLTKHYGGVQALDDANFILHAGEHVAVVGDNGAGKSTFVRQITAVEQRTAGQIFFDGKEVTHAGPLDAREAGIETVFQTLALADDLDVPSNLFLGRELVGPGGFLDDSKMEAETRKIMARLNPNFRKFNVPVSALSGGQRQSVAIARAVYFNAKILIMDEPTAALGVKEGNMVLELIRRVRDKGLPVVLISHNMPHVFEVADRIHIARLGKRAAVVNPKFISMSDTVAVMTGAKAVSDLPPEALAY